MRLWCSSTLLKCTTFSVITSTHLNTASLSAGSKFILVSFLSSCFLYFGRCDLQALFWVLGVNIEDVFSCEQHHCRKRTVKTNFKTTQRQNKQVAPLSLSPSSMTVNKPREKMATQNPFAHLLAPELCVAIIFFLVVFFRIT